MLDDVQQEYVSNTLTLEKTPTYRFKVVYHYILVNIITMKNLISNIDNFQNNLYLVLFIKIISSLIPKLNYDNILVDF